MHNTRINAYIHIFTYNLFVFYIVLSLPLSFEFFHVLSTLKNLYFYNHACNECFGGHFDDLSVVTYMNSMQIENKKNFFLKRSFKIGHAIYIV